MNIKVINYKFTPEEVYALYRLILYIGWISREDPEIVEVTNRICKIAQTHDMVDRVS